MKDKITIVLLNALPDKKIKSLGNKCLIGIEKQNNLFDHHINIINSLFKNYELIVVGGFDSKRLKKYIDQNYEDIVYIDHAIDKYTNIGTSIRVAVDRIKTNNCFIINSGILLNKNIKNILQKNLQQSFLFTSDYYSEVGCTIDDLSKIIHCYYGLDKNRPLEIINICKKDFNIFNAVCKNTKIDRLFFFEIINLCITNQINIKNIDICKKMFHIVDSISTLKKIKDKKYV